MTGVGRVCKFYAWLEDNDTTPIEVKLPVLDNCLFNSILYGVETWRSIKCIEQELRTIEQKALKAILKVKKGTSNDLLHSELKRADIISNIMDRQWAFYQCLLKTNENDALVKYVLELCKDTKIIGYYSTLHGRPKISNIWDREQRILLSTTPMLSYYRSITNVVKKCIIYNSFMDDCKRSFITRWRLSNHKLHIETGRYKIPPIPRESRKCISCNSLEDEHHTIFVCPRFNSIRLPFAHLLNQYTTVRAILDLDLLDNLQVTNLISEIDSKLDKNNILNIFFYYIISTVHHYNHHVCTCFFFSSLYRIYFWFLC